MSDVTVRLRGDDALTVTLQGDLSVRALKAELKAKLTALPAKFTQQPLKPCDVLLVFDPVNPTPLKDDDQLDPTSIDHLEAFEVFFAAPVDLFRTVKPSQVHPCVPSACPNALSEVAPLLCGSLQRELEAKAPHFYLDHGTVAVRGMSLRSREVVTQGPYPTSPVQKDEAKRLSKYDIMKMAEPADQRSPFKRLHTKDLFHDPPTSASRMDETKRDKSPPGTSGRRDETVKRTLYFCFKLQAETDLKGVGAAVVFDNGDAAEPGHFTLVPWPLDNSFQTTAHWFPPDARNEPHLWQRDPQAAEPNHPEGFYYDIAGGRYLVFPFVAQLFSLNYLLMQASAEPSEDDIEGGNASSAAATLLGGAQLLFEHSSQLMNSLSVLQTIELMRRQQFCVDGLSEGVLRLFGVAVSELQSKLAESRPALQDALDLVEEQLMHADDLPPFPAAMRGWPSPNTQRRTYAEVARSPPPSSEQ